MNGVVNSGLRQVQSYYIPTVFSPKHNTGIFKPQEKKLNDIL